MSNMKSQIDGKKIFLGIIQLLGGIILIIVPAAKLKLQELSFILLGIPLVMLGTTYIWEAIEGLRKRKREGQENKYTK